MMNFNPMQQMLNQFQPRMQTQSQQIPTPQQNGINIPINPQQFKQWLPQINDNIIQQLAQQARQQGMAEQDINSGLNFINSLRSNS